MNRILANVIFVCYLISHVTATQQDAVPPNAAKNFCSAGSNSFNFRSTYITHIGPNFLSGSSATCIDLQDNTITEIASTAFSGLRFLKQLYLGNNSIVNLNDVLSSGLSTLEILDLKGARAHFPNALSISGSFPALRTLSLGNNYLTDVQATRNPYPRLERLDLSGNQLRTVYSRIVIPASLTHLDISGNMLTDFYQTHLTKLTSLNLTSNSFETVRYTRRIASEVCLIGLRSLKQLILAFNAIRTIDPDAFKDTDKLEVLDLSHNYISSISPSVFSKLKNLKSLFLGGNGMLTVPHFQGILPITYLDLGANLFTDITDNTFRWAPSLQTLHLDRNRIRRVTINAFVDLRRLEILDMNSNSLSTLPNGWDFHMLRLAHLDLRNNKFVSLQSVALYMSSSLQKLYFDRNPIEYFTASSFTSVPHNLAVYINTGPKSISLLQ